MSNTKSDRAECRECGVELGAGYLCDECDGKISQVDD